MKPQCIVYMADIDISRDNGAGINERGFVDALEDQPDVVCVLPAPLYPSTYFRPGIQYAWGHHGRWWRYPLYVISLCWRMMGIRRRFRIAAIGVRLGLSPIIPLLLARILKVPLLLKTHSNREPYETVPWRKILLARGEWARRLRRARIQYYLLRPFYNATVRTSAIIDCPSETCRQAVLSEIVVTPERVKAIPNGANVDLYRPLDARSLRAALGLPVDAYVVGYVGALGGEGRHVKLLVEVLVELSARTSLYGLIIGTGPEQLALEQAVRKAGAAHRVLFPGFLPNRDIPIHLSAMDLAADLTAIALRLKGAAQYGSYSQKISQYLACGVPVLAWDIPDTRFLAENDIGFLAPLCDKAGLLNTIEEALRVKEVERKAMKLRARAYAEHVLSYKVLTLQRLALWRAACGLPSTPDMSDAVPCR